MEKETNTGAPESQLFSYIWKYKHSLESNVLKPEMVQERLFPQLSSKGVSNIYSKLSGLTEHFLLIERLRTKHHSERHLLLAGIYQSRGLNAHFEYEVNKVQHSVERSGSYDLWNQWRLFRTLHLQYFSNDPAKYRDSGKTLKSLLQSLEDQYNHLGLFYLIEARNRATLLQEDWDEELVRIPALLDYQSPNADSNILKQLWLLWEEKSDARYDEVKKNLILNHSVMGKELSLVVLLHLTNYCSYQTKLGNPIYSDEVFHWHSYGLKTGLLLHNEQLLERRFLNIVYISCKQGRLEWARDFVNEWISNVPTNHPKAIALLATGHIQFASKEYRKVIQTLSLISLPNFHISIQSRWLELCCWCEIRDTQMLESCAQKLLIYIKRHRSDISAPF